MGHTLGNITGAAANLSALSTLPKVKDLPLAGKATFGQRAVISDATVTTYASTVVGGGSNIVPVYFDGTNWKIG